MFTDKTVLNGPVRESNPGPLAPKARIMPLDQQARRVTKKTPAFKKEGTRQGRGLEPDTEHDLYMSIRNIIIMRFVFLSFRKP